MADAAIKKDKKSSKKDKKEEKKEEKEATKQDGIPSHTKADNAARATA